MGPAAVEGQGDENTSITRETETTVAMDTGSPVTLTLLVASLALLENELFAQVYLPGARIRGKLVGRSRCLDSAFIYEIRSVNDFQRLADAVVGQQYANVSVPQLPYEFLQAEDRYGVHS